MRLLGLVFALLLAAGPALAGAFDFPSGFTVREIPANGATIHVRVGGKGPPVVLLHGYGETGDMWVPMAEDLARDHTVIVPGHAAWGSRPGRRAATTRRPRPVTSPA